MKDKRRGRKDISFNRNNLFHFIYVEYVRFVDKNECKNERMRDNNRFIYESGPPKKGLPYQAKKSFCLDTFAPPVLSPNFELETLER